MTADPQLGTLREELVAGWKSRIAGFFLVFIFAAIGVVAGIADENLPVVVVSVVLALALIGLIQFIASAERVRVFEHGIERRGRFRTQRLAWSNLQIYRLQIVDTAVAVGGGAGGLLGVLLARLVMRLVRKGTEVVPNAVTLHGVDGSKVVLTGNVKGYAELLKTLLPFLAERLFQSARQAYDRGEELSFGKRLTLQRGVGLKFKPLLGSAQMLPLELTAGTALENAAFSIRRNDTNAVWHSLPAASIDNLGVLQKFVTTFGRPYDERLPMAWTS